MRVGELRGMQDTVNCAPLASLWFSAASWVLGAFAHPSLWNKAQPACSDAEVLWPRLTAQDSGQIRGKEGAGEVYRGRWDDKDNGSSW